jgi:hypothetical protein
LARSSSSDCVFFRLGECSHPDLAGPTDEARCAPCMKYRGRPRGAGDVLHSIARATGIAQVVERISPKGCGCGKRRAALNAALPMADPEPENR